MIPKKFYRFKNDDLKLLNYFDHPLIELMNWINHKLPYFDLSPIARIVLLDLGEGGVFIDKSIDDTKLELYNFMFEGDSFGCYENEFNAPNLISNRILGASAESRILKCMKSYLMQLQYDKLFNNIIDLNYVLGPMMMNYIYTKNHIKEFEIYPSRFMHLNDSICNNYFVFRNQALYETDLVECIYDT